MCSAAGFGTHRSLLSLETPGKPSPGGSGENNPRNPHNQQLNPNARGETGLGAPTGAHHSISSSSLHYLQSITTSQCNDDSWSIFLPFITLINLLAKQGRHNMTCTYSILAASGHLCSHFRKQGNSGDCVWDGGAKGSRRI